MKRRASRIILALVTRIHRSSRGQTGTAVECLASRAHPGTKGEPGRNMSFRTNIKNKRNLVLTARRFCSCLAKAAIRLDQSKAA
jgi:hypothetical protein